MKKTDRGIWYLEEKDIFRVNFRAKPRKGQTVSGYGKNLPTEYVITTQDKRQHRVKCVCFSNIGTLYIELKGFPYVVVETALEAYKLHHAAEV